ncbi:hypothetical protein [Vannielia litorea]|uniref:Polyketide cyclase / dehydrase and lipid transport n=1 Tax=Vannielia litorea TaxID=1217970 RepID=A0A1N6HL94_9RHOB|nr:hypothetical protein [Vannielia litorea]SIO20541.1 hypothetical protein SAMN05444002_3483 [Vannielia litorea]
MAPLALRALIFGLYAALAYAMFFLVPSDTNVLWLALWFALGLGFAGQLVFDWRRSLGFWVVVGRTSLALLVIAAALVLLWVETVICVAMILPIAILVAVAGIALTRLLLERFESRNRLCAALLALPLVLPVIDMPAPGIEEVISVTTVVTIAAPVAEVRALAENVSDIAADERPWTLTHNVLRAPRPLSATTRNGIRHARWTKGVRFEEHLLPGPDLAWRFAFPEPGLMRALDPRISPTGPEVVMLEGRYVFEPSGPAGTRVSLTTTYRLDTPINPYLKPWGHLLLNDMHNAVLHVIAKRAEAAS